MKTISRAFDRPQNTVLSCAVFLWVVFAGTNAFAANLSVSPDYGNDGMQLVTQNGDSYNECTGPFYEVHAFVGRQNLNASGLYYMYFDILSDAYQNGALPHVVIEADIYDNSTGTVYLEYDSSDSGVMVVPGMPGAFKATGYTALTGVNRWRTLRFAINDARFANRCNDADFRFVFLNSSQPCVGAVRVKEVRPYDAKFVRMDAHHIQGLGEINSPTLVVTNTGYKNWTRDVGIQLISWNPQLNTTWGPNSIKLAPGETILPGQSKSFTFQTVAPMTKGQYEFQWVLLRQSDANPSDYEFFGEWTPDEKIAVGYTAATIGELWNGTATLGPEEEVYLLGSTTIGDFQDPGRVTLVVDPSNNYVWIFFRQSGAGNGSNGGYPFYTFRAVCTDTMGVNFQVLPNAVIDGTSNMPNYGPISSAYDPDVIIGSDGVYLALEGCRNTYQNGFSFSSMIAKANSLGTPASPSPFDLIGLAAQGGTAWDRSASTPNFFKEAWAWTMSLMWVECNVDDQIPIKHHQGNFPGNNLASNITSNCSDYVMPQPTQAWCAPNFGSSSTTWENGTYYMFFEGSDSANALSRWGIGMARTTNYWGRNSWELSARNPLIRADSAWGPNCWIQYPKTIQILGVNYLYYYNGAKNFGTARTTFRRAIIK